MSGRGCAGGWRRIGKSSVCSGSWRPRLAPGRRADATTPISTGARAWRPRWSWRATSISSRGSNASSSRRAGTPRTRELEERATPRPSSARPARRRRGRAGGGGDRGILRARPTRKRPAHGDRRRRPDASPPSRARLRRSTPTWRSCSRSRRAGSTTRSTPAARFWGRSSTARGSARGSRGSTRPSSRPRSAPAARSCAATTIEGTTLWDTTTWKPGRPAPAIVAGRLGGRRLQPGRANAGDRGRKGPRRAVGRVDQEGASGADGPGGRRRTSPRSPSFDTARTAASSPQARWRRTTSRCGQRRDRSGDRPADHHQPAGIRRRAIGSRSARIRSGSPFRALPGPWGSGRSPRGAGSESHS